MPKSEGIFEFGFHHHQLIMHVIGDIWWEDHLDKLREIMQDPRIIPGKTIITVLAGNRLIHSVEEAKTVAEIIAAAKPAAVTTIVYGEAARENCKTVGGFLKAMGVSFKDHYCLDDLFKDIVEKEK